MNHHRYRLPMQADVAELHRAAGLPDRLDTAAEATGVIGRGVPLGKAESEETVRNLLRTGVHDLSAAVVDHDGHVSVCHTLCKWATASDAAGPPGRRHP